VLQKTPSTASEYEAVPDSMAMFPYLQQDLDLAPENSSPWIAVSSILRSSLDGLSSDILNSQFFSPSNLVQFYDLYFNNYHPHFPFLHRPSLVPIEMPLLLLVAIIALGATLSGDPTNFEIAAKVHDDLRFRMCRVSRDHSSLTLTAHNRTIRARLSNLRLLFGACKHCC
jgi:hypothetical protein